jgi:CheY-like chemotaxis protein
MIQLLLADDDADDRTLFQEAVKELSLPVELILLEDGEQLMSYLREVKQPPPPDIIFLDINMPGKTGDVCLKEIRSNPYFNTVPVIMFSTSIHTPYIKEAYANGATLYVSKSLFFEDDVNYLKRILAINWNDYLPQTPAG